MNFNHLYDPQAPSTSQQAMNRPPFPFYYSQSSSNQAPPPPPYHQQQPPMNNHYTYPPQQNLLAPHYYHPTPPNYLSLPQPFTAHHPTPNYFSRPPPPQNYLQNRFLLQEQFERQRIHQLIREYGNTVTPKDEAPPPKKKQKTTEASKKTRLCRRTEENRKCTKEDCGYAHSEDELLPHPLFKTKACTNIKKGVECPFGDKCQYRHDLTEEEKEELN